MALKSLLNNLFEKKDQGPSVEDIDAETEAAVMAIAASARVDIEADKVLDKGWGVAGDMVYMMALAPVYTILGSRVGRIAENLRGTCQEVFAKYCKKGKGQASFVGDNFVMKFDGLGESEGYHRAAVITNEVGTAILGDRFQTVEVPDLLIAADADDVTNADGSLNLEKSEAAFRAGGAAVDKTPKDRVKNVNVAFYPTWAPEQEAVTAYACFTRLKTSRGFIYGNAVYPESAADPLSILIDGKSTKLAVRDMAVMAHFNYRVNLFLPLRFATLAGRHAQSIAGILADITPAWRSQHLVFEILGVPGKATAAHLKPLVAWAKSQGHAAAIRTTAAAADLDRIVDCGAEYVCFDHEERLDDEQKYTGIVRAAHDRGLKTALWNVNQTVGLEGHIDSGFDLVNGSAVVPTAGAAGDQRKLSRHQMLRGF
ncbi:MAG: hypothetical protein HQ483_02705 [Rhodospirillales bacterium]|nr:hypothetical protein [Rhodospirillales bacterium]